VRAIIVCLRVKAGFTVIARGGFDMYASVIASLSPLERTALALLTAFLLGGVIGLERQWRQRTAGLRTNVLVAVGAAAFVDLGLRVAGATLWASAAVGAFAGSAQYGEAALVAVFVLAGNTMLRPVANYINRKPITPEQRRRSIASTSPAGRSSSRMRAIFSSRNSRSITTRSARSRRCPITKT
jgi:uncharacterized membrane protein YhiD involved in acid resistance